MNPNVYSQSSSGKRGKVHDLQTTRWPRVGVWCCSKCSRHLFELVVRASNRPFNALTTSSIAQILVTARNWFCSLNALVMADVLVGVPSAVVEVAASAAPRIWVGDAGSAFRNGKVKAATSRWRYCRGHLSGTCGTYKDQVPFKYQTLCHPHFLGAANRSPAALQHPAANQGNETATSPVIIRQILPKYAWKMVPCGSRCRERGKGGDDKKMGGWGGGF